jgi:hypothetical protein
LDLFAKIGQALNPSQGAPTAALSQFPAAAASLITLSEKTGRPELRLPMPDPQTVNKIADVLAGLAGLLRG